MKCTEEARVVLEETGNRETVSATSSELTVLLTA